VSDLWQSVTDSVKSTLRSAANTYRAVTIMNMVMFGAGLGLFIFAAVYGAISGKLLYAAVFCGFLSLWVSGTFGILESLGFIVLMVVAWRIEDTKWQIKERLGTVLIVLAIKFVDWKILLVVGVA